MTPESAPQGEAPAEPVATAPQPAQPAPETPAPVTQGAAPTPETPPEHPKPSKEERRWAVLSAKLTAESQRSERLAAELDAIRARATPPQPAALPQTPEELERIIDQRAAAKLAQERAQERVSAFHAAGAAAYPDWTERCSSLMQMGADAQFAELLIEVPDGAKVAAALADDPEELERISGLKTERGRAIALGRFAASLADKPAPVVHPKPVSKAPDPIKPIGSGAAKVEFDEHRATSQQLVEYYSRQAMARRA